MKDLYSALSAAQSEFPPILKSATVKVRTDAGAEFSYRYAPLDEIIDTIRPVLAKNGLSFTQGSAAVEGLDKTFIGTSIHHSSGESCVSGLVPLVTKVKYNKNGQDASGPQEMGGGLTYARRYSLCLAFGIASEEDDDANSGEDHHASIERKPQQRAAPETPRAPEHTRKFTADDLRAASAQPLRTPNPSRSEAAALVEKVKAQAGGGVGAQPPEGVVPNDINWHVAPDSWDALWGMCLFRVGNSEDAEALFQEITRGDKPGKQGTVFPGYRNAKMVSDKFKTSEHSWMWVKAFKKFKDHPVFGQTSNAQGEEVPF